MTRKNPYWRTWKPAVPKSILLFAAALTWMGTAVMLNALSYAWLRAEALRSTLFAAAGGFAFALLIHHFGFLRLVDRNLERIRTMEGRPCVFAFMPWKSYVLVAIMVSLGIALRHSLIPRVYLAILYTAIGTALLLSSVRYLRHAILSVRE